MTLTLKLISPQTEGAPPGGPFLTLPEGGSPPTLLDAQRDS